MNSNKKICILGSGIAGCVMARCLAEKGYDITIFEKNDFIGGNCHDYFDANGILIHKFGPHIFHTSFEEVWNFVNRFDSFNGYVNQVLVSVDQKLVPFPINLKSIRCLFPKQAESFIKEIRDSQYNNQSVAISDLLAAFPSEDAQTILQYIYREVYANYTAKMWGHKIEDVDPNVIKRVKINLNEVWNYFPDDKYCGLPTNGYTKLLTKMLDHEKINCVLNVDPHLTFENQLILVGDKHYDKVIYTGSLDVLFNYRYGMLPYRSLSFKFENKPIEHFQEAPIINYPADPKMTRICEYKYLTKQVSSTTTISYEYPGAYTKDDPTWNIPFYPINNFVNITLYNKYKDVVNTFTNLVICGRLAEYKYYDMDDIIQHCIKLSQTI